MPTEIQWLRARAIHAYFKDREGVDTHIYQGVFAFCDCPLQIFCDRGGKASALLTDWNAVVMWVVLSLTLAAVVMWVVMSLTLASVT